MLAKHQERVFAQTRTAKQGQLSAHGFMTRTGRRVGNANVAKSARGETLHTSV